MSAIQYQTMEDTSKISLRPNMSKELAILVAKDIFGLRNINEDTVKEFDSYEDRNFCIEGEMPAENPRPTPAEGEVKNTGRTRYILKVMNLKNTYSPELIDAIDEAMLHLKALRKEGIESPMSLPTLGRDLKTLLSIPRRRELISKEVLQAIEKESKRAKSKTRDTIKSGFDAEGSDILIFQHYVRLLTFIPGDILHSVLITDRLLYDLGVLAAKVTDAFRSFRHPALEQKNSLWDMKNILALQQPLYLHSVTDPLLRGKIDRFLQLYKTVAQPILTQLPMQMIHADISKENVLVREVNGQSEICGLIDFGDISYCYRVMEIASCMSDNCMLREDKVRDCGLILSGFLSQTSLLDVEFKVLYYFVVGRMVQCVILGSYQEVRLNEQNDYTMALTKMGRDCFCDFYEFLGKEDDLIAHWKKIATAPFASL